MATPPSSIQFKKTDFPTSGLGSQEALDKFFTQLNPFLRATASALNGGITLGQNAQAEIKTITITTPATSWVNATLNSGWTNFPSNHTAAYRKDAAGVVWIKGLVTHSSTGPIFILPTGYVPAEDYVVATAINTAGTEGYGRMKVQGLASVVPGQVEIDNGTPSTWGGINISFPCADLSPGVLSCFPVNVSTKVNQPQMVIASTLDAAVSPTVSAAGMVSFLRTSGGFQVTNIPGLTPGKTYNVTLLIIGG